MVQNSKKKSSEDLEPSLLLKLSEEDVNEELELSIISVMIRNDVINKNDKIYQCL
jgi:hypothetical protein